MNTCKYILSDNVKLLIQDEIQQYEGNEIFFGCFIDENNFITEVKPFCYGNKEVVLAPYEIAKTYHAVLHNHPSGNIKPSEEDINYAQYLQNDGIGFFITDNNASKLNCVVPPIILFKKNEKIDYKLIKDFFSLGGIIDKNKEGYEFREGQLEMSLSVTESLNDNKIALIEAGTGIGKSLAYLIPAFLWAEKNNERVVISTNTINLQSQLMTKDIPFVKKVLNSDLEAVIVKGRRNYLCKLKIYNVQNELELDEQAEELNTILKWSAITNDGVVDELNFEPSNDTWEKVSSEVDFCAGKNCSFYTGCFFQIARKKASDSNILIVNHHILFADVDIRSQGRGLEENILLPPYKKIIFDEAHNIVKSASSFFSISFSKSSFYKFLSLFKKKNKGILNRLLNKFHGGRKKNLTDIAEYLENNVISSFNELYDKTYEIFHDMNRYFGKIHEKQNNNYNSYKANLQYRIKKTEWESDIFNDEVLNSLKSLLINLDRFDGALELFLKKFNELKETVKQKYDLDIKLLKSYLMKLSSIQENINGLINVDTDYYVTWLELFGDLADPLFKINATPLEIEKKLYENIYEVFDSITLCSATLTVNSSFDYFKRSSGLSLAKDREIIQKKIDSPFDYQNKVLFVVPVDIPEPGDASYNEKLNDFLITTIKATNGSSFILFTSYNQLKKSVEDVKPILEESGLRCFYQGESEKSKLLDKFINDTHSNLFATSSFWEGVDAPGKTLRYVVLTKLPFTMPTEPMEEAKIEHLEKKGLNPFNDYTLPAAVISFKQGFGRLIRKYDDYGIVALLDSRSMKKSYGRIFFQSLPKCKFYSNTSFETEKAIKNHIEIFEK